MLLPDLDRSHAAPEVTEALQALPHLGVFSLVAHAQSAFRPWLELGGALLASLDLDAAHRELAILQVAQLTGARYEWVQHEAIARHVGVGGEQIDAIVEGRLPIEAFDDTERAVLTFVIEAVRDGRASQGALETLLTRVPPRQVVELLLVVGHYAGIALLARTCELEVDPPAQSAVVDAAHDRREGIR